MKKKYKVKMLYADGTEEILDERFKSKEAAYYEGEKRVSEYYLHTEIDNHVMRKPEHLGEIAGEITYELIEVDEEER